MPRERADTPVRRKYKKHSKQKMTYLGLIANAIQNAPEKRLTFCELMNAVTTFLDVERKGVENNIRVCLSSHDCFVKEPINPGYPNAKRNFWKVDGSKITSKILRRHFRGLQDVFPDLYVNMEIPSARDETENRATCERPEAVKKFTSPFSIESLLQRESSASVRHKPVPCADRNSENKLLARANEDRVLAYKTKTWDWPNQTAYTNFNGSYSHFCLPACSLGQMIGCSSSSGSSMRMHSVSEPSFCTSRKGCTPFPSNTLSWAYI